VDLQDRDNSKNKQMLRQRLKEGGEESQSRSHSAENTKRQGRNINFSLFFALCDTASLPLDIAQRAALTRRSLD